MNRLSPLITRRAGPLAAARNAGISDAFQNAGTDRLLNDLRLFATGWIGGLIFFGTFLA